VGGYKSPPTLIRKLKMRLSVFKKYQNESDKPFACINEDHAMPLVPFMTDELIIELRCFVSECGYKVIPGLITYKKILDKK
jgi:hypothetical protein